MNKYYIVIPFYNHASFLAELITNLEEFSYPILIINDGSDENNYQQMLSLVANNDLITLVDHKVNKGKGAAIKTGLYWAIEKGFTHALQIDADGQHNTLDIPNFIRCSQYNPDALICGAPIYDKSIPKTRLYLRYLTHTWIWINTLSFTIKDSMCGFRVYPIKKTVSTLEKYSIEDRMAFDIDIIVRLYWEGMPILNKETKVTYPKDGVSHFNPFMDNLLISKVHAKLFFFMLTKVSKKVINKVMK